MTNYPNPGEWVLCNIITPSPRKWRILQFQERKTGPKFWNDSINGVSIYEPGEIQSWYRPDELIQHVGHLRNQIRQCGQERTQLGNEVLDLRAEVDAWKTKHAMLKAGIQIMETVQDLFISACVKNGVCPQEVFPQWGWEECDKNVQWQYHADVDASECLGCNLMETSRLEECWDACKNTKEVHP